MAGVVHVHVGQCGNQVGERFWSLASATYQDEGPLAGRGCPLYHPDGKAACVLVDSESKVIDKIRNHSILQDTIRPSNVCLDSNGRANNWAMGFMSSTKELEQERGLFYQATEALRREMERVDIVQGVHLWHSLAGGTGSGLGSALLQHTHDCYPSLPIVSTSVGPFSTGDCPTQWYNTLFSLHYLIRYASAIIYRENDQSLAHYLKASAACTSDKRPPATTPTLAGLNYCLAADVACAVFPTYEMGSRKAGSGRLRPFDPHAMVASCCPFTYAKLVDVRSSWSTFRPYHHSDSWYDITKSLQPTIPTRDTTNQPIITLKTRILYRGVSPKALSDSSNSFAPPEPIDTDLKQAISTTTKCLNHVGWNAQAVDLAFSHEPVKAPLAVQRPKRRSEVPPPSLAISLCSNRGHVVPLVLRSLRKAGVMREARAYLHWYERFGIEAEDFEAAFETSRRVVEDYEALLQPPNPPR